MEGYAKIAKLMGRNNELGIFRRFGALNMHNLLMLQAELTQLEEDLRKLAELDRVSDQGSRKFYAKDWWFLSHDAAAGDGQQWAKVLEIREKLKLYNDSLLQQTLLSRLDRPNKYDLAFLRDWFERPEMGDFPMLGLDQFSWTDKHKRDLVTIRRRAGDDPFSRFISDSLLPWFYRCGGHLLKKELSEHPDSGISEYTAKSILAVLDVVGTVISSLLPITSIIVLYFVTNMGAKLGIVCAYTAVFSLCLVIVTSASRIEIFAATAAFAAVQVVFVSGTAVGRG